MKQEIEHLVQCFGFTTDELKKMMCEQEITDEEQNNLLPIMKENYDGYRFSKKNAEKIYNSNMCLYFLNQYVRYRELPESLIDVNIASDYSKLGNMLALCRNESKLEILEKSISNEGIEIEIIEKFNPEKEFGEREFISMLFYLGYLTIAGENFEKAILQIPNQVTREIYADYFLKVINDETDLSISETEYNEITREVALEGKIDRIVEIVHRYLNNLSNRDYERFDEKYVKIIFYCIAMNIKVYSVRSEPENNRKYQDVLLIPRDASKNYQAVLVEFKYLKKEDEDKLEKMKEEARNQVIKYSKLEQISMIANLNKYTIVAVNDELYVEKVD